MNSWINYENFDFSDVDTSYNAWDYFADFDYENADVSICEDN